MNAPSTIDGPEALESVRTTDDALALWDGLPPVAIPELIGKWRGAEAPTGHPMDGMLAVARWRGKEFVSEEEVHPLVHQGLFGEFRVNPGPMPMSIPHFLRNRLTTFLFLLGQPIIRTSRSRARLRMIDYRGKCSAAMIYDQKPIIDNFRRVADDVMFGLMDMKGMARPYFFTLTREV